MTGFATQKYDSRKVMAIYENFHISRADTWEESCVQNLLNICGWELA